LVGNQGFGQLCHVTQKKAPGQNKKNSPAETTQAKQHPAPRNTLCLGWGGEKGGGAPPKKPPTPPTPPPTKSKPTKWGG